MRVGSTVRIGAVLATASSLLWSGCGGGADIAAPELGSLAVTTATSGPEQDADGYSIIIDAGSPVPVGTNGTLTQSGLAAGAHVVEIAGVAANCSVSATRLSVTVTANTVAPLAFAVTCQPTTGTIQVTTVTSDPSDADGYRLLIDGVEALPIAASETVAMPGVLPGSHTVGLGDVAAGCTVDGDNPLTVTIAAGQTAAVTIAVTCPPPSPEDGTLAVTTRTSGAEPDPDGYAFTIDGGSAQTIGVNATVNVVNLAAGSHAVTLAGASANCAVGGDNPRSVTVPAGGRIEAIFAVTCGATTGTLAVTVAGLPGGTDAAVTVTGPNAYSQTVRATQTFEGLTPGQYTVTAGEVTIGTTTYDANPPSRRVRVPADGIGQATVTYAPAAAATVNLRIDGWQLTQSVQSAAGDIPLVADRDGYLRVFVVANEANTARPAVRVRLYHDAALISTLTIQAPGSSTPTSKDESRLASSWNVKIPRSLIGAGLAVLADVDPDDLIAETNEADNTFPVSGTPRPQDVRPASILAIRFVPVKQRANGLQGDVSDANRSSFLETVRRMYPLPGADGDTHAVYTTTTDGDLQSDDANGAWLTVLSEVDALRVAEGTARTYYGVVRIGYATGIAGLGFIGGATAIGYDRAPDKTRVVAHELGHTWGRLHSPCGSPPQADPAYPYAGGVIGVYGVDMQNEVLESPATPDIMGYCSGPWISDYTYRAVMEYRSRSASAAAVSAPVQRCLLVWGRIVNGQPVLEPAFEVVTRPSLPTTAGPYAVEGLAADGASLFHLSFDATAVADAPRDSRHFAFAVPMGNDAARRLGSLQLSGPGVSARVARAAAPLAAANGQDVVVARRQGGVASLHWDAGAHPMLMVKDPDTGEVLSFARGGDIEVTTDKAELEVIASDQVGSKELRVTVGAP